MEYNDNMSILFDENDFEKRMRQLIDIAWVIFINKVGNGLIVINKEASMQLQFAYILQAILPLCIFDKDEDINISLENTVKLKNNFSYEIDIFLKGSKNMSVYNIAIEMKCYKEYASSGGKRSAMNIFMKDVYIDLEMLENYKRENICQDKIFLAMTDFETLVNPKKKDGKCWDYDVSNNYHLKPKQINTPIGGKDQLINISDDYVFSWIKKGGYYFLKF